VTSSEASTEAAGAEAADIEMAGAPPEVPPEGRPGGHGVLWGAAAGIAAGLLSLGLAEIVAGIISPSASPLVALGDVVVDQVPPGLKDLAISWFGTHDKQVLLGTAFVIAVLLSAAAGVLAVRGKQAGTYLVLVLGALAAGAAATRPDATAFSIMPSIAGALAGMITLSKLAPVTRAAVLAPPGSRAQEVSRRRAVIGLSTVVAAGAVSGGIGRLLGSRLRGADTSRAAIALPAPADPAAALPAGVEVGVPGVAPFITPNADFYRIDTALVVPRLTAEDWSLRIHGLVEREVTISYQDLLDAALVERDITLMCVSNYVGGDLTSNARWLGVPIRSVLAQAGPTPGADMVLSKSSDGFTAGTPLDVLLDPGRDSLLAIGMNGEPLPIEHGFPVRMVVPGLYGYVSATKWVVDLKVTRFADDEGYWTPRGWSATGPIKPGSRFDVPKDVSQVPAGQVALAGVAWCEHRGIARVQVQRDGGEWLEAQVAAQASPDTWRQWVYRWDATPGRYRWRVRAITSDGEVQTGEGAEPAPDGATGWHVIDVTVTA
jgi:DMSO/TMAO reductase YedYZ molybdopterin-dependent catalytic subunit